MPKKTESEEPKTDEQAPAAESPKVVYSLPELGVSVEARSTEEAIKLAKGQRNG